MSWLLPVLGAWAILSLPGYLVLCAIGARTPLRWGMSPPVTVVIVVALTSLFSALGIPWTPATASIGAVALVLGCVLARQLVRRRGGPRPAAERSTSDARPRGPVGWVWRPTALVTAVAGGLGLLVAASSSSRMGGLDTLNGSFDAYFHLSAIAFIRDGGDASLTSALVGIYGERTFYPVVFDALAAVIPTDPVTGANALMLALLAALPSSVAAMVGLILRPARALPAAAVLGAAASTLFLSTASMGLVMGLWPVVLGTVCLPTAIAGAVRLLDTSRERPSPVSAAVCLLAMMGAVLAHPSILFSVAVVAGLLVLVTGLRRALDGQIALGLVQSAAALVAAAGFLAVSALGLAGMHLTRPSGAPLELLLGRVLTDTPRIPVIAAQVWPLALVWLLAAVGAGVAVRRRETVGTAAVLGVAATVVLGVATDSAHPLAVALVNPWYGARERIAPLMMCLLVLLVARALVAVTETRGGRLRVASSAVAVAALLATAVTGSVVDQRLPLLGSLAYTAYGLQLSPYVTPEERDFIERSAAELPADAVVLADPRDGATLFWSLGGVGTVYPTMASPQTRDQMLIANYVTEPDDRRLVCGALAREGPTHLYRDSSEFSGRAMNPEASAPWTGVHEIPDSLLTLVDSEGPYALYELEAPC